MCSLLQPNDSAEGKEKFSQDTVSSVNKAVEVVLHLERCIIYCKLVCAGNLGSPQSPLEKGCLLNSGQEQRYTVIPVYMICNMIVPTVSINILSFSVCVCVCV